MPERTFMLQCAHCSGETKIIIEVPKKSISMRGKKGKKIQLTRYCEHCNRPNIINVPETWDENPLTFGDDHPIIGSRNGVPVIKGEKF